MRPRAKEPDGAALLRAAARGDEWALAALYDRHAGWLTVRMTRRCATPDVVDHAGADQERLHRGEGRVRGQRPHVVYHRPGPARRPGPSLAPRRGPGAARSSAVPVAERAEQRRRRSPWLQERPAGGVIVGQQVQVARDPPGPGQHHGHKRCPSEIVAEGPQAGHQSHTVNVITAPNLNYPRQPRPASAQPRAKPQFAPLI